MRGSRRSRRSVWHAATRRISWTLISWSVVATYALLAAGMTLIAAGSSGTATNLFQNPSLESATNATPDCWQLGGYGQNTFSWARTADSHTGGFAESLTVTSVSYGDRKLVSRQDSGVCAPAAVRGHTYAFSAWYKSPDHPVIFAYYRTTYGTWKYWTQSQKLPGSSSWALASWTTPAFPRGATSISIGLGLSRVGTVTMDDLTLTDTVAAPPPPSSTPPPTPVDSTPPTTAISCNGGSCATSFGGPVSVALAAVDNSGGSGLNQIRYTTDGTTPSVITGTPYANAFMVSAPSVVNYLAIDNAGNVEPVESQTIQVSVADTAPPVVALTSPTDGGTVAGMSTLSATATDDKGVAHIDFQVDGQTVNTDTSPPYTFSWNSQNVPDGSHAVRALAADGAGNSAMSAVATVNVANSATSPPAERVYTWGFDTPHCANNLWAVSPWLSPACSDSDWYTEGLYYSVTDPDKPGRVLTQDSSGVDSTGTWQAWTHQPLTIDGSKWGTEHQVDIDVKLVRWGSQAQSICSWAGGPKIFLGRPEDQYETSTYTVELAICDGSVHIQKKEWGVFRCGQDPRAVDCGAGGTWYLLAEARPGVPSFGIWHRFTAIKRDNPDGSVTIIGRRDGVEVLRYTEVPNDLPLGPLRGGREGWRSNAVDWHMDSYTVTVR